MAHRHRVQAGESIATICELYGLNAEVVWQAEENEPLRRSRTSPHVLAVGDLVHIPDKRQKEVTLETGRRHRLRRKGVPRKLRLILRDPYGARANVPWVIDFEGLRVRGKTDGQGQLEAWVPRGVRKAQLKVGNQLHALDLSHLEPVDDDVGARARLENLGYLEADAGDADYRGALLRFQQRMALPVTGELDVATERALAQAHAC